MYFKIRSIYIIFFLIGKITVLPSKFLIQNILLIVMFKNTILKESTFLNDRNEFKIIIRKYTIRSIFYIFPLS